MLRKILTFIAKLIILVPFTLYSQGDLTGELGNQLEEILDDGNEQSEENLTEWFEEFSELASQKQNINLLTQETLEKLPFLTSYQLHKFLEYREKYGRIYSENELWLIPGFHEDIVKKFLFFFDCGYSMRPPDSPSRSLKWAKQSFLLRTKMENPVRKGFSQDIDTTARFRGIPAYRLLKYELDQKESLRLGITMENDAGEAFAFNSENYGFDFQSAFLELKSKKNMDKIILGDFRITSAEGLIYSSGRNSKAYAKSFRRAMPELKKYSSTSEYGFYRGTAIQVNRGKFRIISFFSRNRGSAKIYNTNDEIRYFQSLNTTGLHRNIYENASSNNVTLREAGIILVRTSDRFQVGYNGKYSSYSPSMEWSLLGDRWSEKEISPKLFWHSAFYNFQHGKLFVAGEFAMGKYKAPAFLQKASLFLHPLITLNLGYRNFSPSYFCPGANTISESGNPQNEKGFFTGITAYPFQFLKVNTYIDFYRFPRIDYQSTFPISGNDFLLDTEWYISRNLDLRIFFKTENKESKRSAEETGINKMEFERTTRFYLQLGMKINENLYSRFRLEIKNMSGNERSPTSGILIYQEISRSIFQQKLKFNLRYTLFDIPYWDVRIYAWEHDLLYSFSSPAWYKTGYNAFFNLRWKVSGWCSLGLKCSATGYTAPRESGTGADYRKSEKYFEGKMQVIIKLSELGLNRFED